MRTSTLRRLVLFLILGVPLVARGTHQVGGHIEMKAVGNTAGQYRITVINYLEDGTRGAANQSTSGILGIFRKRDNALMTTFIVRQTGSRVPVVYANGFCAAQRNLKFIVLTYEADIQLSPGNYSDPEGYYMSYQTRNRNVGINNISIPDQTGFTFYLEFPAIQQNNQLFGNSSPHFGPINGEYICLGDAFSFPFGGTDPDGDELRYSMITPLNQKGAIGQNGTTNPVSAGPYPDVNWLSGYDADNAIPGSPSLRVDAKTGELSVTATQLGLFVFAVKVEEYRNGVKIGEVRRDFQLLVIDCPPQTTPDPAVQVKNRPKQAVTTICQGDSAVLVAALDPNWNYQWRKDDINIAGAVNSTLAVRESGQYSVVVSQKAVCSKVGNSDVIKVDVIGSDARVSATGHLCATTGSIKLVATGVTDVTYQWYKDNQSLTGQITDSLRATEAGKYWAVLTYRTLGCKARTDTAVLDRSPAVLATITSSSGFNRICPDNSLPLIGSGGLLYRWQKDGKPISNNESSQMVASSPGTFVVTATDIYGCEGTSDPVTITGVAPVVVTLDSIPGVCGPNNPAYSLTGNPPGGDFGGTGIDTNAFSPEQAGVGNHTITYTVKPAPECAGTAATRIAVVAPIPTIQLIDSLTTYRGNTFSLNPVYTGDPVQFQWTSSTYLDNPTAANPTITDIADDVTYTIDVKNSTGCEVKDTIHIRVFARAWVPDAFSPNGDGQNDILELPGIAAFPDAVFTLFNRWGEVVYSSKKGYTNPFDGTLNGTALPTGVYGYTLYTAPGKPVINGRIMLVR
ncbi:gliding motility-associated C-terminal domain-containing protein [Spirosoma fluviale]|uniref:Gliding motility-associated C-terminal domain-containing protein n=1 Tax=Spirosoma fluviale TaxID=1597977 RepID=A0A286FH54_9BACT|nr:gliding motility-associated C-terminal domain-containing protein [Spirosoma fluviale]SOD82542.1 gliding motility-associated C-terminal domain-containing protein [Spirosoma fluviale]